MRSTRSVVGINTGHKFASRDVEEQSLQPQFTKYAHSVLACSSRHALVYRADVWFAIFVLLVSLPAASLFVGLRLTPSTILPNQDAAKIFSLGVTLLAVYFTTLLLVIAQSRWPLFFQLHRLLWSSESRPRKRWHWSNMSSRRLRRLVRLDVATIFVMGADRASVPIFVAGDTTVGDIIQTLRNRRLIPHSSKYHALYLHGRLSRLPELATMQELGTTALSHFDLRVRVLGGSGRPRRDGNGARMAEIFAAEHVQEDGEPKKKTKRRRGKPRKASSKAAEKVNVEGNDSDDLDGDFTGSDTSDDQSESDSDSDIQVVEPVTNAEMADLLSGSSKTVGASSSGRKKRKASDRAEKPPAKKRNTSDTAPPPAPDDEPLPATKAAETKTVKASRERTAVAFLFFERVELNAKGQAGLDGDRHFRCLHGDHKVITITKKMKSSTNGLVGYLKSHAPPMYRLQQILAERAREDPAVTGRSNEPTTEEIEIAQGRRTFDEVSEESYLARLRQGQPTLSETISRQKARAWDQREFERLLAEWVAECDQPFDETA
ncbi:hypothetical protein MIND_01344300 [Mycena indigotica]|uniref:Uncharacterized protein n=1 Tax=Mycena indigotica TaxID=2126181 RepID=A0A8H6VPW3_9AGAR|nr:uncharacterized protein MIND_01344300 [Mycena indigotica]KAF7289712.1 hypothetical protein MIND_01344300 [Mycena indigotica]